MPYIGRKPAGSPPRINRSHIHAQGMVAFYVFHEGGGSTVTDLVYGRTGTFTNSPTWNTSTAGNAANNGHSVNFASASSQYIDLGSPAILDLNVTGAMSVAASYKMTTVPNFTNGIIGSNGAQWTLDVEGPSYGPRLYINNGGGGALVAESRAPVAGEWRVAGGGFANALSGYLATEGKIVTSVSIPFGTIPTSATTTRLGISGSGSGAFNGNLGWFALWNRYLPQEVMCDFQKDPFACLIRRTPRIVFSAPSGTPPATTISGSSVILIGSSGTITLVGPATSISGSSAISIGSSGTVTLVKPNVSISGSSAISIGSTGTVTFAAPATSISGSSAISIGSSGTVTFTGPAGTVISGSSAISIGSSGTVTLTKPNTSISGSSAISIGSSGTITLTGPAGSTTISGSSAISIGSSGTVTFTTPVTNTTISGSSAILIGSSGLITLTGDKYGPDNDIFQDIQDRLIALGVFAPDGVEFGSPAEVLQRSARQYPCAAIQWTRFNEPSRFDFGDKIRSVGFSITLVVREEEPRRRHQSLSVLCAKVQNAIDGKSLASKTFPAMTQLNTGIYQPNPNHPEQRLVLSGTFTYEVVGYDARDESEPAY